MEKGGRNMQEKRNEFFNFMRLSLCQMVNPVASTGAEINAFSQNQEKYAK